MHLRQKITVTICTDNVITHGFCVDTAKSLRLQITV